MPRQVSPMTFYSQHINEFGKSIFQASGESPGMEVKHLYLAHILGGLASNPATMLNIEEHLDYAVKLAELAGQKMP